MKKIVHVAIFIALFSNISFAYIVFPNIEELVKENNLIVIGKLQDVSETETESQRISKGILIIERVIFGSFRDISGQSLKPGDKLKVEWTNSKMIACQFGFSANEKEIWFLNIDNLGNIESLSAGSTAELNELREVKKQLKQQNRSDKFSKIIRTQNNQINRSISQSNQDEETVKCLYSIQEKPKKYSPLSALLVAIFSISLYFVMYRSRFKIR